MTKQNKAILICTECLSRNYQVSRGTQSHVRLELKKHCKNCNKHTIHKESR